MIRYGKIKKYLVQIAGVDSLAAGDRVWNRDHGLGRVITWVKIDGAAAAVIVYDKSTGAGHLLTQRRLDDVPGDVWRVDFSKGQKRSLTIPPPDPARPRRCEDHKSGS